MCVFLPAFWELCKCLWVFLHFTLSLALSLPILSLSPLSHFLVLPVSFRQPSAVSDSTSMPQMPVAHLFREDVQLSFFIVRFPSVLCQAALTSVFVELLCINWHAEDIPSRAHVLTSFYVKITVFLIVILFIIIGFGCMLFDDWPIICTVPAASCILSCCAFMWFLDVVQEPELWGAPGAGQSQCDWSHSVWHPAPVYQHSL